MWWRADPRLSSKWHELEIRYGDPCCAISSRLGCSFVINLPPLSFTLWWLMCLTELELRKLLLMRHHNHFVYWISLCFNKGLCATSFSRNVIHRFLVFPKSHIAECHLTESWNHRNFIMPNIIPDSSPSRTSFFQNV